MKYLTASLGLVLFFGLPQSTKAQEIGEIPSLASQTFRMHELAERSCKGIESESDQARCRQSAKDFFAQNPIPCEEAGARVVRFQLVRTICSSVLVPRLVLIMTGNSTDQCVRASQLIPVVTANSLSGGPDGVMARTCVSRERNPFTATREMEKCYQSYSLAQAYLQALDQYEDDAELKLISLRANEALKPSMGVHPNELACRKDELRDARKSSDVVKPGTSSGASSGASSGESQPQASGAL
jgi:hypothetical protein